MNGFLRDRWGMPLPCARRSGGSLADTRQCPSGVIQSLLRTLPEYSLSLPNTLLKVSRSSSGKLDDTVLRRKAKGTLDYSTANALAAFERKRSRVSMPAPAPGLSLEKRSISKLGSEFR